MLRKFFSLLGMLLGTALLALFIIGAFFEDQVGELFIRELNKSLKSNLRIENVDLSLIKYFPEASVTLQGVKLNGAYPESGTFLEAENLSLRFKALSLLSGKYNITSVDISNGAMLVLVDKNGRASYDIFKETSESNDSNSEFNIALQNTALQNIELIYIDETSQQELAMNIEKATAKGEFSNEKFTLQSEADIFSGYIEMEEERYLVGKKINYNTAIDIDLNKGIYRFDKVTVEVDDNNTFVVDGEVTAGGQSTDYDLTIKGIDCSLSSVLDLLPVKYERSFGDFESAGTFYINSFIKGRYDELNTPLVNVSFGLDDGKITSPRLDYALKDASFKAIFNNGGNKGRNGYFELPNFTGLLHGEAIEMNLRATNFDDPNIFFGFKGNIPMDAVHDLMNIEGIEDGDGFFDIKELEISGKYKDMIDPYGIARVNANARMNFNDFEVEINGKDVTIEAGELSLKDNKLSVQEVNFTAPGTDLLITGAFNNLIPVFFKDSTNSKQAKLEFEANLNGTRLDLDELMALTYTDVEESEVTAQEFDSLRQENIEENEDFFSLIEGKFEANIDQVNYRKIDGKSLTGQLIFNDGQLKIRNVKVDAMKGNFTLRGDVNFDEKPDLKTRIYCDNIDVREFFRQAENFGQEELTYKNLKGTLNAKFMVEAQWNELGEFLEDELTILSDVELKDGELIGLKMLEEYSKYIKIQDLRRIKFTNTRNQFAVKNNTFYIPTMFIQSNALNMTFSGRHSTEKGMDYLVKVNGGQTLLNKFKRYNKDRKALKAKKKGFINIYTHIYGNTENYQFKYGKKNYKRTLENDLEREYAAIRQAVSQALSVEVLYEPDEVLDEGEMGPHQSNYLREIPKRVTSQENWKTTQNPNIPDEEYDPELDLEMNY